MSDKMKWRYTGFFCHDAPVWECPKCRFKSEDVDSGYLFCPNCGERLDLDYDDLFGKNEAESED